MDKTTMRWIMTGALAAVLAAPSLTWAQPGGPGPGQEGKMDEKLPPREREALLKEFRENNPEGFEQLKRMRRDRPKQFRRRMRGMRPILKDPKARETMRKNWKAEAKLRKLVEAFRKAEDKGEKSKLKGEIRTALSDQFDAKIKGHEMHLQQMETRIVEMKKRISKRRKLKKKIVEQKLGQITGGEESWDW